MPEKRMCPWAIDDGDIRMRRQKIDFVHCQIIAVDRQGRVDPSHFAQVIERAAAARNLLRPPDAQLFEKRHKVAGTVGQQLQFFARLRQMHREWSSCGGGQIDQFPEKIGMHAVRSVRTDAPEDAQSSRQMLAAALHLLRDPCRVQAQNFEECDRSWQPDTSRFDSRRRPGNVANRRRPPVGRFGNAPVDDFPLDRCRCRQQLFSRSQLRELRRRTARWLMTSLSQAVNGCEG